MMDQELRDFLGLMIGDLKSGVDRLSGVVASQSVLIREIEIKSTTRVAELQKDIEEFRKDITEIRTDQRSMDESQKFKWKTFAEQRETRDRVQAEKDEKQAVINSGFGTINKLLWVIITMVLSIGIVFVWQLIVSGGIKGLP